MIRASRDHGTTASAAVPDAAAATRRAVRRSSRRKAAPATPRYQSTTWPCPWPCQRLRRVVDAVTADVACRFRSGQRKTKLLLHRARQETRARCAAASRCLHHLCDARPFGSTQQCQQALLLGNSRDLWFVSLQWRLCGGDSLGLRFNRSRRFLGVGSRRRDLTPGCRLRLGAPLLRCGALRVPGFYGKGRHRLGSVGSRRRT